MTLSFNFVGPDVAVFFDPLLEPLGFRLEEVPFFIGEQSGRHIHLQLAMPFGDRLYPNEHDLNLSAFVNLECAGLGEFHVFGEILSDFVDRNAETCVTFYEIEPFA